MDKEVWLLEKINSPTTIYYTENHKDGYETSDVYEATCFGNEEAAETARLSWLGSPTEWVSRGHLFCD